MKFQITYFSLYDKWLLKCIMSIAYIIKLREFYCENRCNCVAVPIFKCSKSCAKIDQSIYREIVHKVDYNWLCIFIVFVQSEQLRL